MFPVQIIHKIVLYVKNAEIAQLLYYNDKYREYIEENESIYDELVLNYTDIEEHHYGDVKRLKSIWKIIFNDEHKKKYLLDAIILDNDIKCFKWIYDQKELKEKTTLYNIINFILDMGNTEMIKYMYDNDERHKKLITKIIYRENNPRLHAISTMAKIICDEINDKNRI